MKAEPADSMKTPVRQLVMTTCANLMYPSTEKITWVQIDSHKIRPCPHGCGYTHSFFYVVCGLENLLFSLLEYIKPVFFFGGGALFDVIFVCYVCLCCFSS